MSALPSSFYAAIARRIWPRDHVALHLLHALEVRALHSGRRDSALLTKAEKAAVARELARLAPEEAP